MSRLVYRVLLLALPPDFRWRFGEQITTAFEDALAASFATGGASAWLGAWRRGLVDWAGTVAVAWRDRLRGRRVSRSITHEPKRPANAVEPYRRPLPTLPPDTEPMTTFLQDTKYTFRSLRHAIGFTVVSVLTLALGIGAVTAIFSVVNAVLLQPLPYEDPDELVLLWARNPSQGQEQYFVAPMDLHDWRTQNATFQLMSGYWPTHNTLTIPGEDPARLRTVLVTGEFFNLLRATPAVGRLLVPEDENTPSKAILSHATWMSRFGGREEVVGESITLDGSPIEIVGVTRPGFAFPEDVEVWLNVNWDISTAQSRFARWMSAIGRMETDVDLVGAQTDLDVITARLEEEYPASNQGWSSTMTPMHEVVVGDVRPALLVLLGATGLILLIACANVANLQLSRSETRQREVAVRAALGADRVRIGRQLITESLALAGAGAVVGIALAWGALRLLIVVSPANLPRIDSIGIDATVLGFALISTVLTGVLFGVAPAYRLLGADMNETLKEGTKGTAGGEKLMLRNSFVVMEVALAVMLVIGAGLLIRSFDNLQSSDPGFNPDGVLTLMLDLPGGTFADNAAVLQFYRDLEERLTALPDVTQASLTSTLPLDESVDYYSSFTIPDREPPPPGEQDQAYFRQVGHDFFRTMGVQLLSGRGFTEQDRDDAPGVVIINDTMARQFWPDEDPVGERLTGTQQTYGPLGSMLHNEVEIVGVVQDVAYAGVREAPQPSLYFPSRQAPFRRMTVLVRTDREPQELVGSVRAAVAEIDPGLPVSRIATMAQVMERSVAQERFSMLLLLLFGAAALMLAAVGIYGVLSYNVEQRTRELGIRMALGAAGGEVRGLVLRQAGLMIAIGIVVGLGGALALSRVLESQLFGVSARDPLTFAGVAVLLAGVAFAASYVPARRATSVDPIVALRNE